MEEHIGPQLQRMMAELFRLGIDPDHDDPFGEVEFSTRPDVFFALTARLSDGAGVEAFRDALRAEFGHTK